MRPEIALISAAKALIVIASGGWSELDSGYLSIIAKIKTPANTPAAIR